jgi:hypothetical protein
VGLKNKKPVITSTRRLGFIENDLAEVTDFQNSAVYSHFYWGEKNRSLAKTVYCPIFALPKKGMAL